MGHTGVEGQGRRGPLTGIWRSRYEYPSSSRGATFASSHYVMVIHHGDRLQVRSLPGTAQGRVMMDLTASGPVLTGTWTEETDPGGYYRGSMYHGAIQLTAGPSGTRLAGEWVGFGKDGEVNTGPWTLDLVSADTGMAAMEKYNRPVDEHQADELGGADARCPPDRSDRNRYAVGTLLPAATAADGTVMAR